MDPEIVKSHLIIMNNPQQLTDKDVNVLYNCADIGLNTCDGEGFGLCNFEHGAIGIPQVIPQVGGFRDYFNLENSFIVKPKWSYYSDNSRDIVSGEAEICDIDDIIRMLEHAYENKDKLEKFGQKARKYILENYKWEDKAKTFYECIKYHTKDIVKESSPLLQNSQVGGFNKDMVIDLPSFSIDTSKKVEAQNKINITNVEVYDANEEDDKIDISQIQENVFKEGQQNTFEVKNNSTIDASKIVKDELLKEKHEEIIKVEDSVSAPKMSEEMKKLIEMQEQLNNMIKAMISK
jgi:hypothetical protein